MEYNQIKMKLKMKLKKIFLKIESYFERYGKQTTLVVLILALCAGAAALVCRSGPGTLPFRRTAALTAVAEHSAKVYDGVETGNRITATLPKGTSVEVTETPNEHPGWIKIRTADGTVGWCGRQDFDFSGVDLGPLPFTVSSKPVPAVPGPAFSSPPKEVAPAQVTLKQASLPLAVFVTIADQRVTVLDTKQRIVEQFVCSTGAQGSETPTGTFTVKDRGRSFFSQSLNEGGYYWTQFEGDFLFHSVPFDKDRRIEPEEEAKLGTPASHGCVRLAVPDAKWIYDNIPRGTRVTIRS